MDVANVLAGANQSPVGLPPQPHERRDLVMIAALVYHPDVRLFLFDTGSRENVIKSWAKKALECGPRIWDKSVHSLPKAIKVTSTREITDAKAVVLSHLHCDHVGPKAYESIDELGQYRVGLWKFRLFDSMSKAL